MKKSILSSITILLAFAVFPLAFTSCDNIYSGGTGGHVVNSESTSNPKTGIASVDVYAYMSKSQRDSDFSAWKEGTVFEPHVPYYGHTVSNEDGSFSISRLLWKESKPDFGKDADYTKVYLIFFHKNYGLVKNETIIISDSTTDTITVEMTSIVKTTELTLNFNDVTGGNTSVPLNVEITVPQTTSTLPTAKPIVYKRTYNGTGTLTVSYPRWQSKADRENGIETTPMVTVKYEQNAEPQNVTWKACYAGDNEEQNFAFRTDTSLDQAGITKQISGTLYTLNFYGKTTRPSLPILSGQYKNKGNEYDDGVIIKMFAMKLPDGTYAIDCGQTSTEPETLGASGQLRHGTFGGLGTGYFWIDETYTGRFATTTVMITDGNETSPIFQEFEVRSDDGTRTVQLQLPE